MAKDEDPRVRVSREDKKKLGKHPKKRVHELIENEPRLKAQIKELKAQLQAQTKASLKSVKQPSPKEEHPCKFHFYLEKEDKVLCSKDYDKRGSIHTIPREVCDQCWARRQKTLEARRQAPIKVHPCEFYNFDNKDMTILCSRDFAKKGVIRKVTQDICDACWEYKIKPTKQQMDKAHDLFHQVMMGQEPFKNYPCPHRRSDNNLELIFCARKITQSGIISERQVKYWKILNVGQCRECMERYERAKELQHKIREEQARRRELSSMRRVNWGKAEGTVYG